MDEVLMSSDHKSVTVLAGGTPLTAPNAEDALCIGLTAEIWSRCVGVAISAFVRAVLEGSTQPGVWYPEEPEGIAIEAREILLKRAAEGTSNFVMNKSPWMIEKDPKQLGFGIYS